MGNWKLEVGKMALYMSFPVAMFHYFNQPDYFEEWVIKTKRECYPPENKKDKEDIERLIKNLKMKEIQNFD